MKCKKGLLFSGSWKWVLTSKNTHSKPREQQAPIAIKNNGTREQKALASYRMNKLLENQYLASETKNRSSQVPARAGNALNPHNSSLAKANQYWYQVDINTEDQKLSK